MRLAPYTFAAVCALALYPAMRAKAAEPSELDGTWIEVPRERLRIRYSPPLGSATLIISGNSFVMKAGDRPFRQSLFKPVASDGPKAVDLMTVVGNEFWLTRAIYQIEGDILTICESAQDKPRPTEFRTETEGELTLMTVYRRQAAPPKVKTGP